MGLRSKLKRGARRLATKVATPFAPVAWKEYNELRYWKQRKADEGALTNDHYKVFFTDHFGLTDDDYQGKTVLDIGCGPRGSLEWATMANRTIGLDPLAEQYLKLGADKHRMEYLSEPSEAIPLPDASCDIVCSFNSLDHVDDLMQSIAEIKRVTKPGGHFLLLLELNHAPTPTEPHDIKPSIVDDFAPEFIPHDVTVYKTELNENGHGQGVYPAIRIGETYDDPYTVTDLSYLSVRFTRETVGG